MVYTVFSFNYQYYLFALQALAGPLTSFSDQGVNALTNIAAGRPPTFSSSTTSSSSTAANPDTLGTQLRHRGAPSQNTSSTGS